MIVTASTLSTALARKTATARVTELLVCMLPVSSFRRYAYVPGDKATGGFVRAICPRNALVAQHEASLGAQPHAHGVPPLPTLFGENPREQERPIPAKACSYPRPQNATSRTVAMNWAASGATIRTAEGRTNMLSSSLLAGRRGRLAVTVTPAS